MKELTNQQLNCQKTWLTVIINYPSWQPYWQKLLNVHEILYHHLTNTCTSLKLKKLIRTAQGEYLFYVNSKDPDQAANPCTLISECWSGCSHTINMCIVLVDVIQQARMGVQLVWGFAVCRRDETHIALARPIWSCKMGKAAHLSCEQKDVAYVCAL